MTKKQYIEYTEKSKEIEEIKRFLYWCGVKYHCKCIAQYPFRIGKAKKFNLRMERHFCEEYENTYKIPDELQGKIIDVIENYVEQKEKELEDI